MRRAEAELIDLSRPRTARPRRLPADADSARDRRPGRVRVFEEVGLDIEATRASLAGAAQRQVAETAALRVEAEHEVRRKLEALARMDRDYEIGELGAENYERLTAKWAPELTAAQAQVARLKQREAELAAEGLQAVEEELLTYLAELRAAIAGQVSGAVGLAAVRAAIVRLFEASYIARPPIGPREQIAAEVVASIEEDARARGEAPVAAGERGSSRYRVRTCSWASARVGGRSCGVSRWRVRTLPSP